MFSNFFRLFVPYVYKYATFKITANLQVYQQCGARLFALWHTYMYMRNIKKHFVYRTQI